MNEDALIEVQYGHLYAEMQTNSRISATLVTLSLTATAAILSYGVKISAQHQWIVFFFPFVVLLPVLKYLTSQLEATIKNAAYLKVFAEGDCSIARYETRWLEFRLRGSINSPMGRYTSSLSLLFTLIGVTCLLLGWLLSPPVGKHEIVSRSVLTAVVVLVFAPTLMCLQKAFKPAMMVRFCEEWNKIKENETIDG